ncbi:MAG: hypothetical protein ACE5EG_11150, partial [Thermoanaerobaculia bacterium]
MRRTGTLLLLALLAAAPPAGSSRAAAVETAAEPDVFALTPEMERFIEARVRPGQSRSTRVRGLMDALFGKNGLDIEYGDDETKSASETFESG